MLWQNDEYSFASPFFGMLRETYEDQPYLNKPYDNDDLDEPIKTPPKKVEKVIKKTGPKNDSKKVKKFKF